MMCCRVLVVFLALACGCAGRTFTQLGNGVAVPVESIAEYAETHGISRAEARIRMRAESDVQRIEAHAAKYGVTIEEATIQLQRADESAASSRHPGEST